MKCLLAGQQVSWSCIVPHLPVISTPSYPITFILIAIIGSRLTTRRALLSASFATGLLLLPGIVVIDVFLGEVTGVRLENYQGLDSIFFLSALAMLAQIAIFTTTCIAVTYLSREQKDRV
jgi:hypothetical protein